jgi:hypothetical protein
MSRPRIRVLEMDRDLAARVQDDGYERARERCTAEWLSLPTGPVFGRLTEQDASGYLGLLVPRRQLEWPDRGHPIQCLRWRRDTGGNAVRRRLREGAPGLLLRLHAPGAVLEPA